MGIKAVSNVASHQIIMFHRRLVLLIGERAWAEGVTNATLVKLPTSGKKLRVLRADLRDPPARAWMGQELDLVVLTAHRRGFLDTFGAVAGTLKAGGVLFFHTPPWEVWNQERLGARWCKLLTSLCNDSKIGEFITVCKEEDGLPQVQERIDSMDSRNSNQLHPNVLTPNAEQKALIQKVLKIKSSRPLLIFGRRGRGKSASLGMAAAVLLQRGCRIVVTSPSKDGGFFSSKKIRKCEDSSLFDKLKACKTSTPSTKSMRKPLFCLVCLLKPFLEKKEATSQLFWSAEMFLGGALPRNLTSQKAGIDFVDPQVLVRGHYDLRETFLIVDEAAGFPVNFTVELLQKAGRVLLATTLDGDLVFRKFRMGSHFMGGFVSSQFVFFSPFYWKEVHLIYVNQAALVRASMPPAETPEKQTAPQAPAQKHRKVEGQDFIKQSVTCFHN